VAGTHSLQSGENPGRRSNHPQCKAMRTCLECHDVLVGREDKKFCCDGCRNAYNNRGNRVREKLLREVNAKLRRNYRILSGLNPSDKTKIPRARLLESGFDFNYCTSIRSGPRGDYFFVYDQGYRLLDDRFCLLVKRP
jgi:hypothetical protein